MSWGRRGARRLKSRVAAVPGGVLQCGLEVVSHQQHDVGVLDRIDLVGRELQVVRLCAGGRQVLHLDTVATDLRRGLGEGKEGRDDLGRISLSLLATIYDKAETIPSPGDDVLDLLGFAGGSTSDQGFLERQAIANLTYDRDRLHANWHTRYIGATEMTPFDDTFPEIGSHVYHDVRFSFDLGAQKNSEVYVGVTNLFDKEPPFFASGSSGTQALDTIPAFYDVFGRSYYAGTRVRF